MLSRETYKPYMRIVKIKTIVRQNSQTFFVCVNNFSNKKKLFNHNPTTTTTNTAPKPENLKFFVCNIKVEPFVIIIVMKKTNEGTVKKRNEKEEKKNYDFRPF